MEKLTRLTTIYNNDDNDDNDDDNDACMHTPTGRYVEEGDSSVKPPLWLPKLAVLGRISVAVHIASSFEGRRVAVPVSLDALEGAYSISPVLGRLTTSLSSNPNHKPHSKPPSP